MKYLYYIIWFRLSHSIPAHLALNSRDRFDRKQHVLSLSSTCVMMMLSWYYAYYSETTLIVLIITVINLFLGFESERATAARGLLIYYQLPYYTSQYDQFGCRRVAIHNNMYIVPSIYIVYRQKIKFKKGTISKRDSNNNEPHVKV